MKKLSLFCCVFVVLAGCAEKEPEEDPSEIENWAINEDSSWEVQPFQDQKLAEFILPQPQEILILEEP